MPEPDMNIRQELVNTLGDLTDLLPTTKSPAQEPTGAPTTTGPNALPDLPHPSEFPGRPAIAQPLPEFEAFQSALAYLGIEQPGTWQIWITLANFEARLRRLEAQP